MSASTHVSEEELKGVLLLARNMPDEQRDQLFARLDEQMPNWRKKSALLMLSARDEKLLKFLCRGYSNKEIAAELRVADSTAKNSLSRMFDVIQVRDRVNAVLWAHQHGMELGEPR